MTRSWPLLAAVLALLCVRCLGFLLGASLWGWIPVFDLSTLGLSAMIYLLGFGGRENRSAHAASAVGARCRTRIREGVVFLCVGRLRRGRPKQGSVGDVGRGSLAASA